MRLARLLGTTAMNHRRRSLPGRGAGGTTGRPHSRTDPQGDLVVAATRFVRAPQTADSAVIAGTNEAHARIQYLNPVGDASGRLVLNDLRGLAVHHGRERDGAGYVPGHSHPRRRLRRLDVPQRDRSRGDAFHPQFAAAGTPGFGKFYTAYSARSDSGRADYLDDDAGSHESVIREWTADEPRANVFTGSSREVFRIGQFAPNHNIGTIAFNPTAVAGSPEYGLLYASLGMPGRPTIPATRTVSQ